MTLGFVERARLLDGNWKIRPAAGLYFKRHWCEIVDAVRGCAFRRYGNRRQQENRDERFGLDEGILLGRDPTKSSHMQPPMAELFRKPSQSTKP